MAVLLGPKPQNLERTDKCKHFRKQNNIEAPLQD
ncbi:hypothetical protein CCACVL1_12277 [Corchorus capsularis]|uniref:Uncharacterized protein n=1 Tax=Corchorus capsularis TaxID=210143 RepID=A0A1R3IGK7_COCAP|nr:hypothetical protein CCACVL1_12277 [Corchorus capsularis]